MATIKPLCGEFRRKKSKKKRKTTNLCFVEWHPKGNVILTGGKDYMIWMFNGQNGEFLSCFSGHEGDVIQAQFTLNDNGKHVLSCSSDKTIRLWSPMK